MRIDVITIFPEMFDPVLNASMMKRAQVAKKIIIKVHDLRDYTQDKHKKVDDRPFGGGPGMVMMAQPIFDAVKAIKGRRRAKVILLCPSGRTWCQTLAKDFSFERNLILICGHYEGVDARIYDLVDESVSIGDYVLTGGELPAMVLIDSIARLLPGVLGQADSLKDESFEGDLLDFPQYTRPANFHGKKVPDVLLSGNHSTIKLWRKEQARIRTKSNRPDLLRNK